MDVAHRTWEKIFGHPAMVCALFECDPPITGRRVIGFGAAVFVSADFADAELSNPRPFINARFIEGLHAGRPVMLSNSGIARGNAGAGLDVLQLYGSWIDPILIPEEKIQVQTLLSISLVQLLAGYRLHRMFAEAIGNEIDLMRKSGVVQELAAFPDHNRVLNLATWSDAVKQTFSLAPVFLKRLRPSARLSAAEQELLLSALLGHTDAELAVSLKLSLPAVKARWRSIMARMAQVDQTPAPEFMGTTGRGPQKRHRLLAWLRDHPEELRPYDMDNSEADVRFQG